jgi:nicotinate-nucleotide adenylyltransferase
MKLGLFGGSFDPVHSGHFLMARAACEELELGRLVFLPAAQSPLKAEPQSITPQARLRLLRLALAGCPEYDIDEQEIRRGGMSYTVDTLRDYRRRFPDAELFYLIGQDHVPLLPKWREPEELARLAVFVVIPRPSETPQPLPAPFRGRVLRGFQFGVSSSQIRERVRRKLSIRGLVPDAVAEAIEREKLYL